MKQKSILAIIPARAGSKGVPGKNRKKLLGTPLITYTIKAALEANYIKEVVITTDDEAVKETGEKFNVDVITRPARFSTDKSSSESAVIHCLRTLQKREKFFEYFILLQPTSPLRTSFHIDDCCEKFFSTENNSAISITDNAHHPYKTFFIKNKEMLPVKGWKLLSSPRQKLPANFRQNGAIYLLSTTRFLEEKSFIIRPVMGYRMKPEESIDIDTELDFKIAEMLMKASRNNDMA